MEYIILKEVVLKGNRCEYVCEFPDSLSKYLVDVNQNLFIELPAQYEANSVPKGILTIPFVGSFLCVSMMFNVGIKVPVLDKTFFESLSSVKDAYKKMYPYAEFCFDVLPDKIVDCTYDVQQTPSIFFTGGLDATSALIDRIAEKPLLVNIWGGDLLLNDVDAHKELSHYFDRITKQIGNQYVFVKSNCRRYFNELELENRLAQIIKPEHNHGWWASIAHILSMTTVIAPIEYLTRTGLHYFVSEKVKAKRKIAWIHTDYSTIATDIDMDLKMWNKFDYIMAVSEECKNAFLKKYSSLKGKVKVMENITSPEFIRKMAEEDIEENIKEDDSFKLVSVARFSHAKGIDNAVKALKLLHDRGLTDIKWYVVGYGGDEEIIRKLIKENNLEESFILLGKKINPYPYMKACDLYVQPSRYEGKAVTVGEAQILGRPVIITNYTTAKSQVRENIDGYICELSIEGIANGIEKLYKDKNLRTQLSDNCKKTNYSNSNELNNLYSIFN